MPCLLVLLILVAPRVVSALLWYFTNWFDAAFTGRLPLLILGVVLMPFTTLAYAWAVRAEGGVHSTFHVVVITIAVLVDFGALAGTRRRRRR